MALLDIIRDAAALVGVAPPTSSASGDLTTQQLVALAQMEGDELARRHDWRGLHLQGQVVGDGTSVNFALPFDFDRFVAGAALWRDEVLIQPLIGPVSAAEWTGITSAITAGVTRIYRVVSTVIQIWPVLGAGDVVKLEYISRAWVVSGNGQLRRLRWESDTDITPIPERLITLGIVWRWKRQKGLPYDEERATYEREVAMAADADRGPPRLVVTGRAGDDLAPILAPDTIRVP